jgi:hypothetical protein
MIDKKKVSSSLSKLKSSVKEEVEEFEFSSSSSSSSITSSISTSISNDPFTKEVFTEMHKSARKYKTKDFSFEAGVKLKKRSAWIKVNWKREPRKQRVTIHRIFKK